MRWEGFFLSGQPKPFMYWHPRSLNEKWSCQGASSLNQPRLWQASLVYNAVKQGYIKVHIIRCREGAIDRVKDTTMAGKVQ